MVQAPLQPPAQRATTVGCGAAHRLPRFQPSHWCPRARVCASVCAHVVTDNPTPPDGCARGLRPANKPSHQGSPLCGRGPPSRPLLCSPE